MAGSNTFGGTIKLEGEKEYREAISQINSDLKVFSSELGKLTAEFGRNDKSTKGLTERYKVLTEQIDKQKEKVAILKEAVADSAQKYGENDKKTNNWKVSLNKAEAELTKMEKELDSNNEQLEENKKNLDGGSKSLGKFSKSEDEAGRKALKFGNLVKANLISEAIIGGLKKLGDSVKSFKDYIMGGIESAAGFGREMSAMSEKTGISTEVLQKFSAAAKMTEVDVETFTKSYAKSIKSMSSVNFDAKNLNAMSKAYKTLGIEVRDSSGNLRDAQTVFWETIDGLKNMENETERNSIALQIFGKSAMELTPIIKRGSEGLNDLTKNMATFDDATLESLRGLDISLQKFRGVMDGIKRSIGVAFAPMMKEIADAAANAGGKLRGLFTAIAKGEDQEAINKKFEDFKNSVTGLAEKIREQMPLFIDIGEKILAALWEGMKTAFEPILPQVIGWGALIAGAIIGWQALVAGAVAALAPVITAAISAIGSLIAVAIAAWPVTLAVAIAGIVTFLTVKFWPQIKEWGLGLWDNIKTFFSEHWQDMLLWIVSWPAALIKTLNDAGVWEKIGQWLGGILDGIKNWFSELCQKTSEWASDMWSGFLEFLSNLPEKIGYWLGFALGSIVRFLIDSWKALLQFGKDAWNFVTVDIPNIIKEIINWFSKLPERISEWLKKTFDKIRDWGKQSSEKAKETGKAFIDAVINFFKELPGKIGRWLKETIDKIKTWGPNMVREGKDMAAQMSENILNTIKKLPGQVYDIGKNIIEGIWNGIKSMGSWISEKVKGFCRNFLGGFKSGLGIASPSKLFKEQIGKNLALGIGEGFTDEMKSVQKEMQDAIPTNFETDIKTNINTAKKPLASYQNEAGTSGFNIYIENFVNNRPQDVQAFAQELEFYSRRCAFSTG